MSRNHAGAIASGSRMLAVLAGALLITLGSTSFALAQSAVTQYGPQLDEAGIVESGARGESGKGNGPENGIGGQSAGEEAQNGSAGDGTLPFTGYPLSPLVLAVALLLLGGIALRILVPVLDRRAHRA